MIHCIGILDPPGTCHNSGLKYNQGLTLFSPCLTLAVIPSTLNVTSPPFVRNPNLTSNTAFPSGPVTPDDGLTLAPIGLVLGISGSYLFAKFHALSAAIQFTISIIKT